MARYYRRDWRGRFSSGGGSGRPMGGRSGSIRGTGGAKVSPITRRGATRYRAGSAIGGNRRHRYVSGPEATIGAMPGVVRAVSGSGGLLTVATRVQSRRGANRVARGGRPGRGYIVTTDR